jgi:hypothetical protein
LYIKEARSIVHRAKSKVPWAGTRFSSFADWKKTLIVGAKG